MILSVRKTIAQNSLNDLVFMQHTHSNLLVIIQKPKYERKLHTFTAFTAVTL